MHNDNRTITNHRSTAKEGSKRAGKKCLHAKDREKQRCKSGVRSAATAINRLPGANTIFLRKLAKSNVKFSVWCSGIVIEASGG